MSWILVFSVFIVLVGGIFWILQSHSDRTYRPTKERIRIIIETTIDDSIDYVAFDEFCCVQIAYDPELEEIRKRFNAIVDDSSFRDKQTSDQLFGNISANGKLELKSLLGELRAKTT